MELKDITAPHLIFLDTNHHALEIPAYIIRKLPELKAQGKTHCFMEIPYEFQKHVDAYMKDGNRKHLEKIEEGPVGYEGLKAIIIACKETKSGITPILFDKLITNEKAKAFLLSEYYNKCMVNKEETTYVMRDGGELPEEYKEGAKILLQERKDVNRHMKNIMAKYNPKASFTLVGNWHVKHAKQKEGQWKEGDLDEMLEEDPRFKGKMAVMPVRVGGESLAIRAYQGKEAEDNPREGKVDYVAYVPKWRSSLAQIMDVNHTKFEAGFLCLSEKSAKDKCTKLNALLPKNGPFSFKHEAKKLNDRVTGYSVSLDYSGNNTDFVGGLNPLIDALRSNQGKARELAANGANAKEVFIPTERLAIMATKLSKISQAPWVSGKDNYNYNCLILKCKTKAEANSIHEKLEKALKINGFTGFSNSPLIEVSGSEVKIEEGRLRDMTGNELLDHFCEHEKDVHKALPEWMHKVYKAVETDKLKKAAEPKKETEPSIKENKLPTSTVIPKRGFSPP